MTRAEAMATRNGKNIGELLRKYFLAQLADVTDITVSGLRQMAGGFSRENWIFDLEWRDAIGLHHCPLILRRDPPGGLLETSRRTEFAVLRALEGSRVPAPKVHYLDEDGEWFNSPTLIMERVDGTCEWGVLNGSRTLPERVGLAGKFVDVLGAIQEVDWRALGLERVLGAAPADPAGHELRFWEAKLRSVQRESLPELELVLRWLSRRARVAERVVLVHGDYKPGNAMLTASGISAVLDWETVHLGDPLEDLGWVTNPVRGAEHQIKGSWERREIVDAYAARTGYDVSDVELTWWNVFSNWKLAIIILTGLDAFLDGRLDQSYQLPTWLIRAMLKVINA